MQRNRRPLALATLFSSLAAVLASAAVLRHVDQVDQDDVREAVAAMGIEGEGDIPLPIA